MEYRCINLMLPSYRRVHSGKLPRFIRSCVDRATDHTQVKLTILANYDDWETIRYIGTLDIPIDIHLMTTYCQRPHLAIFYNQMYHGTRFNDPDTLVSMVGDDMIWETDGYDQIILDRVNQCGGAGVFYCDDANIFHDQLCVNLFESRRFVDAFGAPWMHESFGTDFIDVIHYRVGQLTNTLQYIPDVILRHDHSTNTSTAEWDETFQGLRSHVGEAVSCEGLIPPHSRFIADNIYRSGVLHG